MRPSAGPSTTILTATLFVFIFAAAAAAQFSESSQKSQAPYSRMQIKPASVHFPTVSQGGAAENGQFNIYDTGNAPLTVNVAVVTLLYGEVPDRLDHAPSPFARICH